MKLPDFLETLDKLAGQGYPNPEKIDVCIIIQSPGSIGGTPTISLENMWRGFDWDNNKILLKPSKPLTTLTIEQLQEQKESVRLGQSYQTYLKHQALQQEINRLKEQINKLTNENEALYQRIKES